MFAVRWPRLITLCKRTFNEQVINPESHLCEVKAFLKSSGQLQTIFSGEEIDFPKTIYYVMSSAVETHALNVLSLALNLHTGVVLDRGATGGECAINLANNKHIFKRSYAMDVTYANHVC